MSRKKNPWTSEPKLFQNAETKIIFTQEKNNTYILLLNIENTYIRKINISYRSEWCYIIDEAVDDGDDDDVECGDDLGNLILYWTFKTFAKYFIGDTPYASVADENIVKFLRNGNRMEKPANCSDIM